MHIIFYFILSIKYTKRDFFLFFTIKYLMVSPINMCDGKAHLTLLQTRPTLYLQINIDMEKASTKFVFLVALLIIASC